MSSHKMKSGGDFDCLLVSGEEKGVVGLPLLSQLLLKHLPLSGNLPCPILRLLAHQFLAFALIAAGSPVF
ncbi:hypothetical protein VNO78_35148 [Psophocarpus tetragonolobus]|uniref:Uncharacterized protein n=1 Tax=Psophocarpus tetragonolobus TaxID=3891 RepID=A0AAN9NN06_PSOTE